MTPLKQCLQLITPINEKTRHLPTDPTDANRGTVRAKGAFFLFSTDKR